MGNKYLMNKNIKKNSLSLNNLESVALFSYFIVVSSRIMLFSSISSFMPHFSSILKYLAMFFAMFIVIVYIIDFPKTLRQLICIITGFTLSFIVMYTNGLQNNFSMAIFLGLSLFGIHLTLRKVAYIQAIGMLFGSIIVIVFSLVGLLPKSGFASKVYLFQSSYQETVYFLGFNHPNAFGTIITMGLILFCLGNDSSRKSFMIITGICAVMDFKVGANTAMMAALLIFMGLILTPWRDRLYRYGYFLITFLLVGLPLLSIWLGINAGTQIGQWVSNRVSARPPIWGYYLSLNPMKLIAIPPQLDLSIGGVSVVGNGVLDGSYIYALVYWGILALILIIIAWKLWIPYIQHPSTFQWILLLFIFAVTVMSFPESHMISYYENTFILGIGLIQFSSSKRSVLINKWHSERESNEIIN